MAGIQTTSDAEADHNVMPGSTKTGRTKQVSGDVIVFGNNVYKSFLKEGLTASQPKDTTSIESNMEVWYLVN